MTLRELKELIETFEESDLDLSLKVVSYLNNVEVELYKTDYLGYESIIIDVYE